MPEHLKHLQESLQEFTQAKDPILQKATQAQARASNPKTSVFVGASAGSGKTKLLIDRLLRLMLPQEMPGEPEKLISGAKPENILCLTFTKAAAAEMQNRLRAKLAEWFSLPEAVLKKQLFDLDIAADNPLICAAARDLLRQVLESPVGVRVETIHAFCESVLRRFPAEANIDPNFAIIEDQAKMTLLTQGTEGAFAENEKAVAVLSPQRNFAGQAPKTAPTIMGMVSDLSKAQTEITDLAAEKPDFEHFKQLYFTALNLSEEDEHWERQWVTPPQEAALVAALRSLRDSGKAKAERIDVLAFLLKAPPQREPLFWENVFFTQKGEIRKKILLKQEKEAVPELENLLLAEAERLCDLKQTAQKVQLAEFGAAFLSLGLKGVSFLKTYKMFTGQLDYDDLIARTQALLEDVSADWVRYQLDGGIDHLLLDEVQDNSPLQWKIVEVLTSDFFTALAPEKGKNRTIFAVGDLKQSIFGFQGARPAEFLKSRTAYAEKIQAAGFTWDGDVSLSVSFRTTQPVLSFVNALFQGEMGEGVRETGREFPLHSPARSEKWGRVEVWPAVKIEAEEESSAAFQPTSASSLVQEICKLLQKHFSGQAKPSLEPKDVLFLVRKRSHLPSNLMGALKKAGIAIVNCIGEPLMATPQAKDMMALCRSLLLPCDDFSFACFLTSPLGGLTDENLMDLRLASKEGDYFPSLWQALQARQTEPVFQKAFEMFKNLLSRVDYDSPYQIFSKALGIFGGRARMYARFGQEAFEPLDRFLEAALEYESLFPPSLENFADWMENNPAEIKRQAAEGENAVRFMTVHGAKGLQAPLVIVLCKKGNPPKADGFYWLETQQGKLPIDKWGESLPPECERAQRERQQALGAEENRLLYVAVTRAADWLIMAGWCNADKGFGQPHWVEKSWETLHHMRGDSEFSAEGAVSLDEMAPLCLTAKAPLPDRLGKKKAALKPPAPLPDWTGEKNHWQAVMPPKEDRLARPLRPSQSEGGILEDLPATNSPLEKKSASQKSTSQKSMRQRAVERGKIIHRILEFLPEIPAQERVAAAVKFLSENGGKTSWKKEEIEKTAQDMAKLLEKPSLAPLFAKGSRAEQPVAGIAAGHVVNGVVDRLNITPEGIYLADYKTGKKFFGEKSAAYQLQLALYADLLKKIYPHLPVKAYLIWTQSLEETEFSEIFLQEALRRWESEKAEKKLPDR